MGVELFGFSDQEEIKGGRRPAIYTVVISVVHALIVCSTFQELPVCTWHLRQFILFMEVMKVKNKSNKTGYFHRYFN